jgi:cell division protein FtsI (penicillin-binding protein 3)
MDNPRYVVLVMLDEPKGHSRGKLSAYGRLHSGCPLCRKRSRASALMLGIIPDMKRDVDVSELMPLLWKAKGKLVSGEL